ncbi:hypothetical protein JW926_07645 [Candidatus Sumerlaeota bacterium]|nr:hypothetical protein [Candidatus Sumerlaeota bacterium]
MLNHEVTKNNLCRDCHSKRLPYCLLICVVALIFVFQNDNHGFQKGHHGFLSSHGMTLSSNLSLKHHLLMFNRMYLEKDGKIYYETYNRFPVGFFLILKIFIFPFSHDFSMQISIARNVMISFFAAALYIAFLSIRRLTKNTSMSMAIVLLSFSSYYCMYYNDMIFNDVPTFFGLLLTFHGMVIYIQENRFPQLLFKVMFGLFFGWQVLALILPFIVYGMLEVWLSSGAFSRVVKSRFLLLGLFSFLFAAFLLSCNLLNESITMKKPFYQIPTFNKMLWRMGLIENKTLRQSEEKIPKGKFLSDQSYRIGRMSIPFIFVPYRGNYRLIIVYGFCVSLCCILAIIYARRKILVTSLFLSGFCWALPMWNFTGIHDFQSIFYIGIPLIFYSFLLILAGKLYKSMIFYSAIIASVIFILTIIQINMFKSVAADTNNNLITSDFQRIADKIGYGRKVYITENYNAIGGAHHGFAYYLSGNYIQKSPDDAEYLLSERKKSFPILLTNENTKVFLFENVSSENQNP